jgi:hypothetical protein
MGCKGSLVKISALRQAKIKQLKGCRANDYFSLYPCLYPVCEIRADKPTFPPVLMPRLEGPAPGENPSHIACPAALARFSGKLAGHARCWPFLAAH